MNSLEVTWILNKIDWRLGRHHFCFTALENLDSDWKLNTYLQIEGVRSRGFYQLYFWISFSPGLSLNVRGFQLPKANKREEMNLMKLMYVTPSLCKTYWNILVHTTLVPCNNLKINFQILTLVVRVGNNFQREFRHASKMLFCNCNVS